VEPPFADASDTRHTWDRVTAGAHRRRAGIALAAVVLFLAQGAGAGLPRNDFLLVLDARVGPYRYLDSFKKGKPRAYAAAHAAFGAPTAFRADGNLCHVTWAGPGVTVRFASGPEPCTGPHLRQAAWYGLSLFGARWHNQLGIRIGSPIDDVRKRFPDARIQRMGKQTWLVLRHRRQDEFDFIKLAVTVSSGRVATIEVPAAYIF
jgi:hypothetical protein